LYYLYVLLAKNSTWCCIISACKYDNNNRKNGIKGKNAKDECIYNRYTYRLLFHGTIKIRTLKTGKEQGIFHSRMGKDWKMLAKFRYINNLHKLQRVCEVGEKRRHRARYIIERYGFIDFIHSNCRLSVDCLLFLCNKWRTTEGQFWTKKHLSRIIGNRHERLGKIWVVLWVNL
jgi:hypothetical protein